MFCSFSFSRALSESSFRLEKKNAYIHFSPSWTGSCDRPLRGLGRTVELSSSLFWINFVYLSLLPFLRVVPSPFLLWHRRLGHVCSPRLRYFISTGLYLTLRFLLIWVANGEKARPFLYLRSSFYFSFWSCVRSPSCPSVIERRIIRICYFWQNNEKIKIKRFLFGVNISPLPSELCLLQLTSLTKRFPNDPASTLLSRMELPSGRHILETARSLLLSASVPSPFLAEAVLTAVGFLNRIPSFGLSLFERRLSARFESIGRGCGGNPRGFV